MYPPRLSRFWALVVCVAAVALFAGARQAKLAQYESKDSNTRYLAQALKIDKSTLGHGTWMMPAQQPSNDRPQPVRVGMVPPEVTVFCSDVLVLPRQSRAPPAAIL